MCCTAAATVMSIINSTSESLKSNFVIRWYPKVVNRDSKNHKLVMDSEGRECGLSCYTAAVFVIVAPCLR